MRILLRIFSTLAVVLGVTILAIGPAQAANGNPHFVKASASASGSSLTVTFKEAGLSSGSVETVTASADWTAQFACFNGGNKHPQAANKETLNGSASASGQFTADTNGNINGDLTITAPSVLTNDFSCPSGQTEVLTYIQWSNVSITDETSGAFAAIPGTFTFGSLV